jgi:tight adherence protein B
VRVLTTQQRYSSYLLSVLPFFIGGLMFLVNPQHMMRLFDPSIRCIPIGALIGIVIGHFSIQRMVKIEV